VNLKVILINVGKHTIGLLADESDRIITSTIKIPGKRKFKINGQFVRHIAFESNRTLPILNIRKILNVAATVMSVND